MTEKDDLEASPQKTSVVSFGEACFGSFSEFGNTENKETLTAARIRHFSESVLSARAWFQSADELIAAMDLVGANVASFWDDFNSTMIAVDGTTDPPTTSQKPKLAPKHQETDARTKYALANQHMMLAGFAIENLCKGYLAGLLTPEEQAQVEAGKLPEKLKTHDLVDLARSVGMTLSEREKDLLQRIGEAAIWRGRYPSPIYHDKIVPFVQWEADVARIKTFFPKLRQYVGAKDSSSN